MTPETEALLERDLERDEGKRSKVYKDSRGILTIGIGRNLQDRGLSDDEILYLLKNDIAEHCELLDRHLPWWRNMDEVRQRALANMAFNLGVGPSDEQPTGHLLTFKNTLAAMARGDYEAAANGMSSSAWAQQVGIRATRLVEMIRTGQP
ncbi:MAG TPA: glycoside hydrolase family protein [Kofleriaceae bacterium]